MLLRNLQKVTGNGMFDISIDGDEITEINGFAEPPGGEQAISFSNAVVFPGLINSHDHLDFNLFPQLGNRVYNNYVEWGNDIQRENKVIIDEIQKIPYELRVKWGVYKNLVNGVTTVVEHGHGSGANNDLITVFEDCKTIHSVAFEKHWRLRLNNPFSKKRPVVIHCGEGSDARSHKEIDELTRWNLRKQDLIAVHGIAMDKRQAASFNALIWCPASNYFLMGKTADVKELKKETTILFGTDSTLSASWSIWDHLRLARKEKSLTDEELYYALTNAAAAQWQLKGGRLEAGYDADIVIARKKNGLEGYEAFYAINAEDIIMVVHKGNIRLYDAELSAQVDGFPGLAGNFGQITVNGRCKYIYGELAALMDQVRGYCPGVVFPF